MTKKSFFGNPRRAWLQAFALALPLAVCIFLPFVLADKGYFFYYGDFNVQQIPFYQLVHRAIRSGDVFWNWHTDLGANFIGSYSFYNLFSPFFWLTLPFPTEWVPYFMAPLLCLKTACAAATGCLFISRFTKNHRYAVLGGLFYAFSGFTAYNIFFNHFHEVIVFFPLILYTLELLVVDGRRGPFALAVAVNAVVNYWFFIGSVIFTLIYFAVRTLSHGWDMTWKKFFAVALESVAGVLLSAAALLPSALAILGNPRTTADNILYGKNFWFYWEEQRQIQIFTSIFFPPDIPSRPNFYPDAGAKWASLSAWLPLAGPSLAISYLIGTKRSWVKRLLWLCLFIAMVPGLNAMFILFNNSYYARWFYMPILFLALASVLALERARTDGSVDLMRGLRITAVITALITVMVGLTPDRTSEASDAAGNKLYDWGIGLEKYPERFWIYVAITAAGLAATWALLRFFLRSPRFLRYFGAALGAMGVIAAFSMICMGRMHSDARDMMRDLVYGEDGSGAIAELSLPQEEGRFDRSDFYSSMDNIGMYLGLPNIQAFHSIVPASLMEFYPSVGVKRDVSSKPQAEFYPLRSLLSVRWLFVKASEPEEKQPPIPYFYLYDSQMGFNIYENENYLPMGLSYDAYATRTQFNAVEESERVKLLHKGILIEDADAREVSQILDRLPDEEAQNLSEEQYLADVRERRESAGTRFDIDNRGFTSEIAPAADSVVFYSVPYDKGWSATVDGVETKVLKVNGGFCGVPVNAGAHVVRFTYLAPGLREGALLSVAGVLLLIALLLAGRRFPLTAGAGVSGDLAGEARVRRHPAAPDESEPDAPEALDEFHWSYDGGEAEAEPPENPPGEDGDAPSSGKD